MNNREAQVESTLSETLMSQDPAEDFAKIISFIASADHKDDSLWTAFLDKMLERMKNGGLSDNENNKANKELYGYIKRFIALAIACGKEHIVVSNVLWQESRKSFIAEADKRQQQHILIMLDSNRTIFKFSKDNQATFWKQNELGSSKFNLPVNSKSPKPKNKLRN